MTYQEAFAAWSADIKPAVVAAYSADDHPALAESWNDYTDTLCKDGELTETEYHHCPAYDDDIPQAGDDQRAFILLAMGVQMTSTHIAERTDSTGSQWDKSASHFAITFTRGSRSFSVEFSQGSAHRGHPDLTDVLQGLLMDTSDVDQDFNDWAESLGYDTDSRRAERAFNACKKELADLERMFNAQELEDLRTIFEDA